MKKVFYLLLVSIFFSGCKENHSIEIHLLKQRIPNAHGIPVNEVPEFKSVNTVDSRKWLKDNTFVNYDTIKKHLIYADSFSAPSPEMINPVPLVNDDEILLLDIKNGVIKISDSGANKIFELKRELATGHQFVITDNGTIVMTGYLWSSFSSYLSEAENIFYSNHREGRTENYYEFQMYKTNYKPAVIEKTNFKNYPALVKAFKETERLIE